MNDAAILVVDDNPDHLELTVMALGECCDVRDIATVTDGVDALDYLFARGAYAARDLNRQPRLILLDMKLIRMHGLDVLKSLRKDSRTATIPVVMHSSSSEKRDISACYAHGANSYVRKATDFNEMRRKMRQIHDFWMTVNERSRADAVDPRQRSRVPDTSRDGQHDPRDVARARGRGQEDIRG